MSTSNKRPIFEYSIDTSVHPSNWPGSTARYISVHKVDVIFVNINYESNFRITRTGTHDSVKEVIVQVTEHLLRGLYSRVSLNASDHSCVVVMSTDKPQEEFTWKNGFPWDTEINPQAKIEL